MSGPGRDATADAVGQHAGSRLLVQVAVLCAAVAFLDGVDTSSINIAAPRLADHLRLSHAQLGPVFSPGLLGAMLGALGFGALADRYGRKRLLLVATTMFGLFTVMTVFIDSFRLLLLMRLLTGIGLGGATPCFIALAAEYAPRVKQARVTGLVWTSHDARHGFEAPRSSRPALRGWSGPPFPWAPCSAPSCAPT